MTYKMIFKIAAQNGWNVSMTERCGNRSFIFQMRTPGGVPFSFTVETEGGDMTGLIDGIVSFVDAINPETCAREWMVKSGAVAPSKFRQAVADMDDIRTKAWLLACDLSEKTGCGSLSDLLRGLD